jgi:xylan 1,4-beta-xylosidase
MSRDIPVAAGVSPAVEPGVAPGGYRANKIAYLARVRRGHAVVSVLIFLSLISCPADVYGQPAHVEVVFSDRLGDLNIDHMALGQGGLSDEPMWSDRIAEIRALHPRIIRLFLQEYFDLLPARNQYHFETLDKSVETILKTGATPLMCICFKPRLLFPHINQDIVEPTDYGEWEQLIFELVKHYRDRQAGIRYWEIANEPDIGEDGGCPYRFKPQSYVRYYEHTARAILRADPDERVGGPALASSRSALLPALLNYCQTNRTPLHFVSWHIYSSDPKSIRGTIDYVRHLLKQYPDLKPETFLDEWNMDLTNPPLDPRFQPCYLTEVIWQMKEAGLDYSCYYHIRDWYVLFDQFAPFMSPQGTAFMTRWWNRMPQFDGLFDYQNQIRPAYYAFKLLSRLRGQRLRLSSDNPSVHGFASHDEQLRMDNVVLWNFSEAPAEVELSFRGLERNTRYRHIMLDAAAPGADENTQLRPEPFVNLQKGDQLLKVSLGSYAVHYWSFE